MALERTYTIPLRRGWLKASRYRRAKKAVITAKEFLAKHMKSEDVRLGTTVNLEIWKHGMKNPPSRVKVNASKDDKGVVRAELFGAPMPEVKKEEKKGVMKKIAEKMTGKTEAPKAEVKPEAPKVEVAKVATVEKPAAPKAPAVKKTPEKKVEVTPQ